MKSISKDDLTRLRVFENELSALHARLDGFHDTLVIAIESYNAALLDFANKLDEINGFGEDVAREIETYMDARSEKWHDSDRAGAYETWKSAWSNITEEMPEVNPVEIPDVPDLMDFVSVLTELPNEPEDT